MARSPRTPRTTRSSRLTDPQLFAAKPVAFAAKLDPSGGHVWSHQLGGAGINPSGAAMDADGNVLVTGGSAPAADFGLGPLPAASSGFVVELEAAGGAALWNSPMAPAQPDTAVATAPAGRVLVTSAFPATSDFTQARRTMVGGSNVFLVEYAR